VRAAVAGAVAALSAAVFHAAPARADVVFDFSGICDGLTCSETATGVLTLADSYVFGADINAASSVRLFVLGRELRDHQRGVGIVLVQVMSSADPFFEVAHPDGFFANSGAKCSHSRLSVALFPPPGR
jgi:hypothetical protein